MWILFRGLTARKGKGEKMKIDTEKGIIWGEHGSATYYINDCGGLELTDSVDAGLSGEEFAEAERELSLRSN
jgi:hypothetical protein